MMARMIECLRVSPGQEEDAAKLDRIDGCVGPSLWLGGRLDDGLRSMGVGWRIGWSVGQWGRFRMRFGDDGGGRNDQRRRS